MKHIWADRRLPLALAILGSLMTVIFAAHARQSGFLAVSLENGPIENAQLALAMLATLAYAGLAIRTEGADRAVAIGMAVLCSMFAVREVDPLSFVPGAALLHDATFKAWFRPAVLIGFGIYLFLRRDLLPGLLRYSFSRAAWPLLLGGAFLVIGNVCEIFYRRLGHGILIFLEETFEAWGFLTVLLAAIWFLRNTLNRA